MRLVSLKQGRDFNYDTTNIFSFSVKENEGYGEEIYVLRAHEGISGKDMQIAKSFNKSEIRGIIKHSVLPEPVPVVTTKCLFCPKTSITDLYWCS